MENEQPKPDQPEIEPSATSNNDDSSSESIQHEATLSYTVSHKPKRENHDIPEQIGRYRVEQILGKGGFGVVYLAQDDELERAVAIKVPLRDRVATAEDVESYLAEARVVATLNHPGIVPVYDVGRNDDDLCYVVSRFIEGTNLRDKLRKSPLAFQESAELVAQVAEALHAAHGQDLVHRDIKPANILIDNTGTPYVCDFGLALREDEIGSNLQYAGTPAYMSPEQASGEGHRVDGRSDIFSLGVVLYELLTGRPPFRGNSALDIVDKVRACDVRPPRQRDNSIPRELERICLKALSRRVSERYTTAWDLAEDLRHFLSGAQQLESIQLSPAAKSATETVDSTQESDLASGVTADSDSQPLKIVPKGLRSFDEHDADFFLELLPGARDRNGLPDSIRFWKQRIEEFDPQKTFSVGLIYGPSGCGKSSLVKAGLLPRLSPNVISVYVEATPDDTEQRLLSGLRKGCGRLPESLDLKQTLSALRRGHGAAAGQKVLIVLDQFEQWLHGNTEDQDSELVQALRQCDGEHVQCLVMVRDDFWLAVSRFLRVLEVRLVEGENSALVDLFDTDHARRVLAAFGRAFGKLPENAEGTTPDEKRFLSDAVEGLAIEAKVICVRLALFADMMKGRPWSPAALKGVGGTEGVGVTFLEETFSANTAPPEHRVHQRAARAVLKTLLPDFGTDIKGHMRSSAELLEASGYENRPQDFDDLIRILDSEIRLITPTDPEGKDADEDSLTTPSDAGEKYYQLTHDYLVHSLREWLTRKQKETRQGRAELALADRASVWQARRENRQLPSLLQWLQIRWYTRAKNWSEPQRSMMHKAGRSLGVRWGTALAVLLVMGIAIQQYVAAIRYRNLVERLDQAVETMGNSPWYKVLDAIGGLREFPRGMAVEKLTAAFQDAKPGQKLSLAYALADYGQADLEFLLSRIADAPAAECANLVTALGHDKDQALQRLLELAKAADSKSDWKLKGRLAVLALHLGDATVAVDVHADRPDPTQQTVFIHDVFSTWHGDISQLTERIERQGNAPLRAGMCLAMGNLPAEQVGAAKDPWRELLTKWYQIAVGTAVASGPPHRSVREVFPHTALAPSRARCRTLGYSWDILGRGK